MSEKERRQIPDNEYEDSVYDAWSEWLAGELTGEELNSRFKSLYEKKTGKDYPSRGRNSELNINDQTGPDSAQHNIE